MSEITWKHNRFGHVEIWQGKDMEGEAELYLQNDIDVKSFFQLLGMEVENIEIGDHDTCVDVGYFE